MRVAPQGRTEAVEAIPAPLTPGIASPGDFDRSPDGRLLAYTLQELRGDVWLLEGGQTTY